MCFFRGGCILKVPPVGIDECKPCRLLALPFHEGEKALKERKVFLPWQCGYALWGIVVPFFVKVGGIEDDEVGFLLRIEKALSLTVMVEIALYIPQIGLNRRCCSYFP